MPRDILIPKSVVRIEPAGRSSDYFSTKLPQILVPSYSSSSTRSTVVRTAGSGGSGGSSSSLTLSAPTTTTVLAKTAPSVTTIGDSNVSIYKPNQYFKGNRKHSTLPLMRLGHGVNFMNRKTKSELLAGVIKQSYLKVTQIRDGTCAPPQTAEANVAGKFVARRAPCHLSLYGLIPLSCGVYETRRNDEQRLRESLIDLCSVPTKTLMPRVAMIVGEPGTGKSTLMAQLLNSAGETFLYEVCKIECVIWLSPRLNGHQPVSEEVVCRYLARALRIDLDNKFDEETVNKPQTNFKQLHETLMTTERASTLVVIDDALPNFSDRRVETALRLAVNSPLRLLVISRQISSVPAKFRSKIVQLERLQDRRKVANIIRAKFHQSNNRALFSNEAVDFFTAKYTGQGLPIFANIIAGHCTTFRHTNELYASLRGTESIGSTTGDINNTGIEENKKRLVTTILDHDIADLRGKLLSFAIFDPGTFVHVKDLAILWGNMPLLDCSTICRSFYDRGLLMAAVNEQDNDENYDEDEAMGNYGLHELVYQILVDYLDKAKHQQGVVLFPTPLNNVLQIAIRFRRKNLAMTILRHLPNFYDESSTFFDFLDDLIEDNTWWEEESIDVSFRLLCQFADKILSAAKSSPFALLDRIARKTRGNYDKLFVAAIEFSCEFLAYALVERGIKTISPHLLSVASKNGDGNLVRFLLKHTAVNRADYVTPLYLAAMFGHEEAVKLLLPSSQHDFQVVDASANNTWFETPLMAACENGHRNVASLLLKSGASPCLLNKFNESALTLAVRNDYEQIVQLLLLERQQRQTADGDAIDKVGLIMTAITRRNEAIATLLVEALSLAFTNERYCMMTLLATAKGDVEALAKNVSLIEYNCDSNHLIYVVNAARLAATDGNFLALKMFLETTVAVEKMTNLSSELIIVIMRKLENDKKPLSAGHKAALRLLFRRAAGSGVIQKEQDESGNSWLISACYYGDEDTARLLLQNGANVNYRNRLGETALIVTIKRYNENIKNVEALVDLLLDYGADVRAVNENGESAFTIISNASENQTGDGVRTEVNEKRDMWQDM